MNDTVVTVVGVGLTALTSVVGAWFASHTDRKIRTRGYLWLAFGCLAQVIMDLLLDDRTLAYVNTALAALHLYSWWNSGGGDGLRKMWKKAKASLTLRQPAGQTA